jgi:hypothetical protein
VFRSLFNRKKTYFAKKTFTYYVPAPPSRKTGYQEREFDSVVEHINSLGYEIIDLKLQSHSSDQKSGLWIICLLGAPSEIINNKRIQFDTTQFDNNSNSTTSEIPLDPSIIHDS